MSSERSEDGRIGDSVSVLKIEGRLVVIMAYGVSITEYLLYQTALHHTYLFIQPPTQNILCRINQLFRTPTSLQPFLSTSQTPHNQPKLFFLGPHFTDPFLITLLLLFQSLESGEFLSFLSNISRREDFGKFGLEIEVESGCYVGFESGGYGWV